MSFRFLALIAALSSSVPVLAQSTQYPFIAPKCFHTLRIPENLAGVYFSEDCRTAFVMPNKYGKLTVESVSDLPNLDLCKGVAQANQTNNQIQAQIMGIVKKMNDMPIESPARDKAVKDIADLTSLQRKLLETYDGIIGGYAQVTFANNNFEDRKNEFLIMNQDLLINSRINLLQMPVSESYLSFRAAPLAGDARMKAVLGHSIPGVGAPNEDGQSEMKNVYMNGSLSGQLALSLYGLCGKRNKPDWKPSDLAGDLVANLTYTVPVMSMASYEAKIKLDFAVHNFLKNIQNKSKFSVRELTEMFDKGSGGTVFEFNLINMELPSVYTKEAQADFFKTLRTEVFTRLTARLLEQLKAAGYLEMEPPNINQAPEPGYIDEVHSSRSCSSSWGGLFSDCSSRTYIVKIPVNSRAETIINKVSSMNFSDVERTEIRQVIPRIYTSAFVKNPPNKKE